MEHPHQPSFGNAAGNHQQQELNLFHSEQPSWLAQAEQLWLNDAADNGTGELSSFGEHSSPVMKRVDTSNLQSCPSEVPRAVPPSSKKRKRTRDWAEAETSGLLKHVNMPKFRYQKRKQYFMKWDAIAAEIQNAVGSEPAVITGKRCQERMKTLRGCYEKVTTEEKEAGVTEEEWRKSKGITVGWWFDAIGEFCGPRKGKLKDRTPGARTYATRFNSLTKSQRSTLLDLYFFAKYLDSMGVCGLLWRTCERMSIMQNRSCLAIYEDVIALQRMGLFRGGSNDEEDEESDDDEELTIGSKRRFLGLLAHGRFFEKAVAEDMNPAYDTRRMIEGIAMVSFGATCAPSRITMLFLNECEELEVVDMSSFRQLRFLSIWNCPKFCKMIGWECLEELRCLEVQECPSYHGFPPLQQLPCLQEFFYGGFDDNPERVNAGGELDVSGCVRLRRLEIGNASALSSIRGLEGLHSLTALKILNCHALRNLPDIGHMKDLTHLSIVCSAVEEIKGVERLSSLKELDCFGSMLKTLPDLSHLPYLQSVEVDGCPMVESMYSDVSDSE